ncbi:MAG TPA: hypothetical protein VF187_11760 [Gemmatimonadales bacterium]
MRFLGIILLVVLVIPVFAILTDSPLGRALARRLEGRSDTPPALDDLQKRVEVLEAELDDLSRGVDTLREEQQFVQRLLEEGGQRPQPPSHPAP